ncbi:hypothetical protein C8J57DRAFT_1522172 [Mycena rebaudengoi]|nr:hypothetical protein C8J57DRAFT_1522172 [Mycena rebaudengoi]
MPAFDPRSLGRPLMRVDGGSGSVKRWRVSPDDAAAHLAHRAPVEPDVSSLVLLVLLPPTDSGTLILRATILARHHLRIVDSHPPSTPASSSCGSPTSQKSNSAAVPRLTTDCVSPTASTRYTLATFPPSFASVAFRSYFLFILPPLPRLELYRFHFTIFLRVPFWAYIPPTFIFSLPFSVLYIFLFPSISRFPRSRLFLQSRAQINPLLPPSSRLRGVCRSARATSPDAIQGAGGARRLSSTTSSSADT